MSPNGGPHRNFGSPKQIREKIEMTNHDRLFGATKIPMGSSDLGTLRIQEKIISIEMDCLVTLYNLGFEQIQNQVKFGFVMWSRFRRENKAI